MAGTADIIIENARVLTMEDSAPHADAVAIAGNTILAVGSRNTVAALAGPRTRVIDAAGGTVLPGFNEGHLHLFAGAAELDHLQLAGVHGREALASAVQAYAAGRPEDPLITAQSADYTILSVDEPVTRQDLDAILPDRPFIMFAPDHHTAWANTAALEKAGILRGRAIGVGNEIVMGPDGLAAGELRENEAFDPVLLLGSAGTRFRLGLSSGGEPDPAPSPAERAFDLGIMRKGLAHAARHGLTSLQNMDGNLYQLELLGELERSGELTARARVPFHMKNFMPLEELERAEEMRRRFHSPMLASGFVKMFVDGVLDSWTAVMLDDYADRPGWRGEPLFDAEHFARVAVEADRRGFQIAVHAIGDGAVRIVLDGYEAARRANGARDSRHRIEHIEVVHPDDVPRFAALGVAASMQPIHAPGTGFPLEPTVGRIGRAKWPYAYAWQTLREAGARLVFATDWPVSPIDPMACIQAALTRRRWRDSDPDQRQTLLDSLASYTRDSAWIEFMEGAKGRLAPGLLADLVILNADLETTEPEAIGTVRPMMTICDGRVVHEA